MKRLLLLVPMSLVLLGCGLWAQTEPAGDSQPVNPIAESATQPVLATATAPPATATPSAVPTVAATETETPLLPSLTPTEEILPTATSQPLDDLALSPEGITLYPVPLLFAGDVVSIQVMPNVPSGLAPNDVDVRILIDGQEVVAGNLNGRNLGGDSFGLYQWVWDTNGQQGTHTITAVLDPEDQIQLGDENADNNEASIIAMVNPRSAMPAAKAEASWLSVANNCCLVHVVSDTAAQRDLAQLSVQVDQAFQQASARLAEPLLGPYQVYFVDRVIGQGGYASSSMVVSYLDRDYAGGGLMEVLVHEAVHLLDQQFAPERITFLSEGLAVWASGGHYKQENLGQRMAALIEIGRYVPLEKVVDNIYLTQHEISYLEAASFLGYLIERYGWPQVRKLYINTTASDGYTQAEALDRNLTDQLDIGLAQAEADWLVYVESLPRDRNAITELSATIRFYEVMRRYQANYDRTAHFLYAWLPPPDEVREMGTTADLNRHPESLANIALETMLQAASIDLHDGRYERVNALLDSVVRVIDNDGMFLDPLANSYLGIVRTAADMGYQVQQIDLVGSRATAVVARDHSSELSLLQLELDASRTWTLTR